MNIRDLKYLVALEEHLHFGKAADVCCISQPTLSMQIKKLEQMLGVILVERTNKSVMLTEIGCQIARYGRAILSQIEDIKHLAETAQNPYAGKVTLGIIPTLAPYFLPCVITKIVQTFPKLKCYLVEEKTPILLKQLTDGAIDAAVLVTPLPFEHGFTIAPLFTEEFVLALYKHHPWSTRANVRHDELFQENFLLLEEGHCLREQALEICAQAKTQQEEFRATSLETLRHMVAAGIGITLMPKLACQKNDQIIYLPFVDPKPGRNLALVWRASTSKKQLLTALVELVKLQFLANSY